MKQQFEKEKKEFLEREAKLNQEKEELQKKATLNVVASTGSSSSSDKDIEIENLKKEVEKWMASAQQLEQLGTEAVQEVYAELETERTSKAELNIQYEEEKRRRQKIEEELMISSQKLAQLDQVMQRLMNLKK
eukprot:TRINITY_DN5766_c0_g1_i1.p1 TRINITY_DN5766_c0_g1~~TRINITY_DN5766_c0_g1_i1.p1  ORF type:complete len:140 (-),score=71.35 TRINITY_DN5766_c0_g1_i1:438-836(-)